MSIPTHDRMLYRTTHAKPCTLASVCVRLADRYGESVATWEGRIFGARSSYRNVGKINGMLVEMGMQAQLAELMAPIEASQCAAPQPNATYREATTDAEEDVLEAAFEANRCVETLRPLLRKRAQMRQASLDLDIELAAKHGLSL
jgi:hypothetical protein